jgi:hypothetical protein
MIQKIINDERLIKSLELVGDLFCTVGKYDVTKIEPYEENGEMSYITWFAIWNENEIMSKINSKYVISVNYAV